VPVRMAGFVCEWTYSTKAGEASFAFLAAPAKQLSRERNETHNSGARE
jgi:hypothetical protein